MNQDPGAFLRSRRSVRHFRTEQVEEEVIRRILTTASYAPSAHNLQPWRFVVIKSLRAKERLIRTITAKFRQDMSAAGVKEPEINDRIERTTQRTMAAPVVIILCQDISRVKVEANPTRQNIELKMGVQSVAAAGMQLLLAAHGEGLAGTWICWPLFAPEETCKALDIPSAWEPQGMIFLGYPVEFPEAPERKPLAEIVIEI
jgi:F420 biosynthesis protein FbiB-like protein